MRQRFYQHIKVVVPNSQSSASPPIDVPIMQVNPEKTSLSVNVAGLTYHSLAGIIAKPGAYLLDESTVRITRPIEISTTNEPPQVVHITVDGVPA